MVLSLRVTVARASRSASVKAGWSVARAVDGAAVVIGHLRAGLRPGGWASCGVPAIERKPNVNRPSQSRHVTTNWKLERSRPPRETLQAADSVLMTRGPGAP